jgi:hypothetical protein
LWLAGWALLVPVAGLHAQQRLPAESRMFKAPATTPLGVIAAGTEVSPGKRDRAHVEVGIEGWVISSSLGGISRDGFDVVITRSPQENLRQSPNGAVIARVITGTGFNRVEAKGGWTRVRRTVWLPERALPPDAPASPAQATSDRVVFTRRAPLALTPGGTSVGGLDSGAAGRALARAGGWTRVQLEAWVPDTLLEPARDGVLAGVTASEVRANPSRYVGRLLEWRVQLVAIARADDLRPEMPAGSPYLLARGPLPEPGFVYIMIPPGQVSEFEGLPALRELVVRGTLRAAASKYLPTPVLELVEVVEGRP